MKNILVFFGVLALILGATQQEAKAQIIDGAYKREEMKDRKPTACLTSEKQMLCGVKKFGAS
jgi:hypothetical protein